jgi:hypothetical protein
MPAPAHSLGRLHRLTQGIAFPLLAECCGHLVPGASLLIAISTWAVLAVTMVCTEHGHTILNLSARLLARDKHTSLDNFPRSATKKITYELRDPILPTLIVRVIPNRRFPQNPDYCIFRLAKLAGTPIY